MWVEFVVAVVVLSVLLGVVARAVSSPRDAAARSGEATDGQQGGAWTAKGPLDAAFPVERTPHERRIGDAAFVDGLVVGYYLAPFRPDEDRDAVQPDRTDLVPDGDDGSTAGAWESLDAATSDEPADQAAADLDLDVDAGYGHGYVSSWDGSQEDTEDDTSEDAFDDGFGFEDGLDDDW